jgi:acyl-CoA reductase-like NAD-dependent aldehyde dehydrogenase
MGSITTTNGTEIFYKAWGFGSEGGPEVIENYTQYKSVLIDLS